jgi:hypothetical protein
VPNFCCWWNTGMFGFLTIAEQSWGLPIIRNGCVSPSAHLIFLSSRAAVSYDWGITLNLFLKVVSPARSRTSSPRVHSRSLTKLFMFRWR